MKNQYDDIIHLPHHVSKTHQRMSNLDRAAQFAPFAALTGHEEAVKEVARRTNEKIELDESELEILNRKLQKINENLPLKQPIKITYYQPDEKKNGGKYLTICQVIKKIDPLNQNIVLMDKSTILFDNLYAIEET